MRSSIVMVQPVSSRRVVTLRPLPSIELVELANVRLPPLDLEDAETEELEDADVDDRDEECAEAELRPDFADALPPFRDVVDPSDIWRVTLQLLSSLDAEEAAWVIEPAATTTIGKSASWRLRTGSLLG